MTTFPRRWILLSAANAAIGLAISALALGEDVLAFKDARVFDGASGDSRCDGDSARWCDFGRHVRRPRFPLVER